MQETFHDSGSVRRIGEPHEFKEGLNVEDFDDLLGIQAELRVLHQPVRSPFGKDPPKLILAHGHERLPGPHEVGAVKMIGSPTRTGWDGEHQDPSIGVSNRLDIDSEPDGLKELLRHTDGIGEGRSADYRSWCLVGNAKQQVPAALVGDGDTVCVQLPVVELGLRLLELQTLILRSRLPPDVYLSRCRSHISLRPAIRGRHLRQLIRRTTRQPLRTSFLVADSRATLPCCLRRTR